MRRRRLRMGRVLDCFALTLSCACACVRAAEDDEEAAVERAALVRSAAAGNRKPGEKVLRLRDLVDGTRTLGFHLEPKTVELRVSMHCHGCARKVQKHIAKMEGVTSFQVDLASKKVVVMGDVTPFEVLQSVSKVKLAQLWMSPQLT
ncbi:hypothetical protein ACP4OV_020290 [Aristida adscensionis]